MVKDLSTLKGEELKLELQRRSLDLLVVHNPLKEPYIVIWNTVERHIVPGNDTDIGYGKGNASLLRFIAEKYMSEMTTNILTKEADEAVRAENEKRMREGRPEMTKYMGGEQVLFEKRTDEPTERERVMKKLFVRLDREYAGGMDSIEHEKKNTTTMVKSVDDELLEKIMANTLAEATVEEIE